MKKTIRHIISIALSILPIISQSKELKQGYIDWGVTGSEFPEALDTWQKGQKWSVDDNFFISRVKPKMRFRNPSTQINPGLDETNDKNLIFWVPINNEGYNALPDGVFDREVFPMWSYVTHYGNWSTPLARIPGNFIDVAHKNGVPVSPVVTTPYGYLPMAWRTALNKLIEVGAEKMADYLEYYGIDGIGYNSEFQSSTKAIPMGLADFHAKLIKLLKPTGRMPLAENIWYDGTDEDGYIQFDKGLGSHNDDLWGYGDDIKTSLFLNYNWNYPTRMQNTVDYANKLGRSPLDIYCGLNLQGKEPHNRMTEIWTRLAEYPLSIGLWGAHSQNMFFESRMEKGSAPDAAQRSYMLRMERWFTGGTRNPVNTPALNNSLKVIVDNYDFFGMSKLMTARSSLKWDLGDEPFITYFNLGNGKFFNYQGIRQHSREWYNIGMQDYLPTWRWWFTDRFMGNTSTDVQAGGLDAEFIWDDAWMGGSLFHVYGTTADEYLHLFKTEFGLRRGDVITLRYKVVKGSSDAYLALSVKGKEKEPVKERALQFMKKSDPRSGLWQTVSFTVNDETSGLEDKELAMIAFHFSDADDLDVRFGEFSIVRGGKVSTSPETPVIEHAELLAADRYGADGKIIFNMPNDKGNDVCYNIDVNTSMFKLYARQEGGEPVLMGMTPSWAGLIFSAPFDHSAAGKGVSFGVSAMSLDMTRESDIAWSGYFPIEDKYELSDDISVDRQVITPGDSFTLSYVDPLHESGDWVLTDEGGNVVAKSEGTSSLEVDRGLSKTGNYDLSLTGMASNGSSRTETVRYFPGFVQVTDKTAGSIPEILTLTANGQETPLQVESGAEVSLAYEAEDSDGVVSRGVRVGESGLGFRFADTECDPSKSFSLSFWFKPEDFGNNSVNMLSIRDNGDKWANNNWGWFWHILKEDGTTSEFTLRSNSGNNIVYEFVNPRLTPGTWQHIAYVFDFDETGAVLPKYYINGKEVQLRLYTRDQAYFGNTIKHEGDLYPWRENNVVAIGGYIHKAGSVRGNIDNLMFWDKALSEDDLRIAMGDIDKENLPENLIGYFDFEEDPLANATFSNKGKGTFGAGSHFYEATEVEGQGTQKYMEPMFCAGSPFLKGEARKIRTKPEWQLAGTVLSSEGDGTSGKALVKFHGDGHYEVTLRLSNEYGESVRSIPVTVGESGTSIVEKEDGLTVGPIPFTTELSVGVDRAGSYEFVISDMGGRVVYRSKAVADGPKRVTLVPDVPSGAYILTVIRDKEVVGGRKIIAHTF